ncbi:copper resistance CopC/CopD family protein [Streptomyces turgidiscabies]|uniref:Protein YobA n=1 Tax=Streptomyces turgidiscabies (strain Car8) TaxID=698760 RepID=L7F9X4_STRT8|nr:MULTISPECIES: copper resistance protein CopC [Streptomyces]ELP68027.1 Tat pathway signal sequence domain protein [Streptomyces turgidiscabies Car8]MDX3500188.1 copper resistance protein CopC [Streptomyces turgidiscabies]GAQ77301.1 copper transport protein YcnJ precursor [Streptomyces turgidiscabies]
MLLGTALVLFLLVGGAGTASAHAALRDTDPRDGSVLDSAPRQVTLSFTESVGLLDDSFRVFDPDGRRVSTGEAKHVEGRSDGVRVSLPKGLGKGTFTVAWRVVSADSHPISGAFTFSIGEASATPAVVDTGPTENAATSALHDVFRYLAYAALALLVGTVVFVLVCRPPGTGPLRRLVLTGWWTLLVSTVALLLLRGPYEAGTTPAAAFDLAVLERTVTGRPGLALLARLALLAATAVLLAVVVRRRRQADGETGVGQATNNQPDVGRPGVDLVGGDRAQSVLLGVGGVLALGLTLTWAAAEHASAGIQVPVAMTSSVLHLLAMAAWLGGLAALLTLLQAEEPLPASTVTRFSRLAFASVAVLTVTGVYQSWRGLGSWDAITGTSYGRILIAKVCAVALLLVAAGFSRRWTGLLSAPEAAEADTETKAEAKAERKAEAKAEAKVAERVPETVGGPANRPGEPVEAVEAGENDAPGEISPADSPSLSLSLSSSYRRRLRRSVLAEVAIGIAVLVITTVLTTTLPGRAAAEAAEAAKDAPTPGVISASTTTIPFDVGTPGGHGKVQVTLEPARVGENTVQAVVFGPDDGFAIVPELRISFSLPSKEIGPLNAEVTDLGGYWGTNSLNLPIAGTWTMKVTIRTSDVDQVSVSRKVKIGR